MKKYILFLLTGALMTSCIDTVVLPTDKTVTEDFWKSRDDVTSMVAGAYKEMASTNNIERFIVWGDFRSEELAVNATVFNDGKRTDLEEIEVGTMDYENQYASWASIYSVINRCNIVLERAPQVVAIDPSYTEGTLRTDESQMLALRALCYFYLVRAFRDVPVTAGATFTSSQNFEIPQEAPLTVLNKCVEDLQEALQVSLSPQGYTDWRRVGYINRDGINAILADVYLWRASMTGSLDDYQKCIDCCDAVIRSKQQQYLSGGNQQMGPGMGNIDHDGYPLYSAENAYNQIFVAGNSIESIFELQLDGENISNNGLAHCYWNYDDRSRTYGLIMANTAKFSGTGDAYLYGSPNDYRYWTSCFDVGSADAAQYNVFKMVSLSGWDGDHEATPLVTPGYTNIRRNWIFYRLTDVMLMKAEALTQLAEQDPDNITRALSLVNTIIKRSLDADNIGVSDTLVSTRYNTKEALETAVLQERQRELCFEGKRWFDLMRYTYRQLRSGANSQAGLLHPELTMHEIGGINNYAETSSILGGVMSEDVSISMEAEPHLYFPVLSDEMQANPLLHQNPAYIRNESIVQQ